jgi:hypothetical protein
MDAAVAKRDLYQIFKRDRRLKTEAADPVMGLQLHELANPSTVVKKINGHAVNAPTPDCVPSQERHEAVEMLTGFGDFDPSIAATDPREAEAQKRKLLELKAARLQARMNTQITVGETTAYRTLCVYRIIRELARIKSCISPDETLAEVNFWRDPPPIPVSVQPEPLYKARFQVVEPLRAMILEFEEFLGHPIPFEPPRDEEDCKYFCYAMEEISNSLYLERGSTLMPDYGIFGTKGLFDWRTAPMVWPSRHELISTEELLIEEVLRKFTADGDKAAKSRLVSKYGTMQHEAVELLHLAFSYSKNMMTSDLEIMRAKVLMGLQHTVDESLLVGDVRAQITALTQMAKISGLLEEREDDYNEEMSRTLRDMRSFVPKRPEKPEIPTRAIEVKD